MATITVLFVCGCLALLLAARGCVATKCYSCNIGGCEDHFNSNSWAVTTIECATGSCTKYKDGDAVSRHCTNAQEKDDCDEDGDRVYCLCTTDFCNSGGPVSYSMALMAGLAFAVVVVTRM